MKEVIDYCESGNIAALQNLECDNFDFEDVDGFRPMMTAIHNNHNEIVKYILNQKNGSQIVLSTNKYCSTGLHVCAYCNNITAAKIILEEATRLGCLDKLLHCTDKWGKTALDQAKYHKNFDIVLAIEESILV